MLSALFFVALVLAVSGDRFQVKIHSPSPETWHRTQCGSPSGKADMPTKWGLLVSADKQPLPEFPRPMMVRAGESMLQDTPASVLRDTGGSNWQNLNGLWQWEKSTSTTPPFNKTLAGTILVPYPVESCLSGVAPTKSADIVKEMWYRQVFDVTVQAQHKLLLHFGAVDWQTKVYMNGNLVGNHTGGYDGFSFDLTQYAKSSKNELLVYAYDPSDEGFQPNGKQRISAIDSPSGDTYTPSSGIWQTVWLEQVPDTYIYSVQLGYDLTSVTVNTIVWTATPVPVKYTVMDGKTVVASGTGQSGKDVTITIPSAKRWSMDSPFLYNLQITSGSDTVLSYFGLRTFALIDATVPVVPPTGPQVGIDRPYGDLPGSPFVLPKADYNLCYAACNTTQGCESWAYAVPTSAVPTCSGFDKPTCFLKGIHAGTYKNPCRVSGDQGTPSGSVKRPQLNGKFQFLSGFLDQSWWPDGQYIAPTDEALKSDLVAVKTFGMNLLRLHQKVNPERWYYHADTVGVAVMQDAPQKYGNASPQTVEPFVHDLVQMIMGRGNHPCIIQWEIFNENDCWSVFTAEPYTPQDLVKLVRKTDWQKRLVNLDTGGKANDGPMNIGDVNSIHDYPYPKHPLPSPSKYAVIGEYGGIGYFHPGKEWVPGKCFTYLPVDTPALEASTYVNMAGTILDVTKDVSASVYTQLTDLELECDGFLTYDRTNKFSATDIAFIVEANKALLQSK